jgi:hypothetical protein
MTVVPVLLQFRHEIAEGHDQLAWDGLWQPTYTGAQNKCSTLSLRRP